MQHRFHQKIHNLSREPRQNSPEPVSKQEYRKQVEEYAKSHNLPQSWVDGISADPTGLKRWLAAHAQAKKIHQEQEDQSWSGWKKEHPNQPLPDEYTSSEQHENNKTTLIVGGIVLGLTALIIYEIYLRIPWLLHTTTLQQEQQQPTNCSQTN